MATKKCRDHQRHRNRFDDAQACNRQPQQGAHHRYGADFEQHKERRRQILPDQDCGNFQGAQEVDLRRATVESENIPEQGIAQKQERVYADERQVVFAHQGV